LNISVKNGFENMLAKHCENDLNKNKLNIVLLIKLLKLLKLFKRLLIIRKTNNLNSDHQMNLVFRCPLFI
jgi:hypothetical protein